jgi:hypothetical protein
MEAIQIVFPLLEKPWNESRGPGNLFQRNLDCNHTKVRDNQACHFWQQSRRSKKDTINCAGGVPPKPES